MTKRSCYDVLAERGFVKQCTDEDAVRKLMAEEKVTAYIGFDPTAKSLHAGSLVPIMGLMHLAREGHNPIALVGGGTGLIGDPSGKTETRQLLTRDTLRENFEGVKAQLGRFLNFESRNVIAVDNSEWLEPLNYVDFLREIGRHFSVNRMLSFEAYKQRMEKGLSFLEFNYQLCQAYDFLVLYQKYGCTLQMGGDDQWGNIVAGVDLVRRVEGAQVYGLTFPLLTTATGAKMGKTATGAVWLSAEMLSPYNYYQYWVNVDDRDVVRFLKMFTLLPLNDIDRLSKLEGADIREAKQVLAFEATKICHGEENAQKALDGARAAFSGGDAVENMPSTELTAAELSAGVRATELFVQTGLCKSNGEAVKLFRSGAGWVGDRHLTDHRDVITLADFANGEVVLRAGKKRRHRIISV
ncbi:MAG: tyrosine--tRNA ligase [Deltaproteobacteria bacterium]|nr:tyrosine--tRNA ligase [Deltaproteobacteria bacterium]